MLAILADMLFSADSQRALVSALQIQTMTERAARRSERLSRPSVVGA
jgi:hypothetical protein